MDGGNDLGGWFTSADYAVVFLIPGTSRCTASWTLAMPPAPILPMILYSWICFVDIG